MNKNQAKKIQKKEAILESARIVFSKKGFIDVTMKDIIEECGISRGGIYLYFSSVDEIFILLLEQRTAKKSDAIRAKIKAGAGFESLLAEYLHSHKERLLNQVEFSLLRATYEYYFTHKTEETRAFQQEQLMSMRATILEIFQLGVRQKAIKDENLVATAEHFIFVIEGLSILALTGDIDSERIEKQFRLMESLLMWGKS